MNDELNRRAPAQPEPAAPRTPNPDEVICPACTHQFRAIPENVQAELHALREAAPTVVEPLTRDVVADIVRNHLTATYHCTRVWEAWSVGTMTEDDFELASESDMAEEIADAILAATPPRAPTVVEPVAWAGYDLDGMVEAFDRVIEAHANKKNPFHNPIDADAQMALRTLRGFIPAMKAYAATPPRAALTFAQLNNIARDAQIAFNLCKYPSYELAFARGIEQAHGIGNGAVIAADRGQG